KAARATVVRLTKTGRRAVAAARWTAVRQHGVEARALLKLSGNARVRRDRHVLSSLEDHLVRESAGMHHPFWISPHAVRRSVRRIVPANVVTFADLSHLLLRDVASETTVRFIDEIVREGRPYRESTLFRQVANGKGKRRRLGTQ